MFFLITGEGNSDVGRETASPGPLICALETLAKTVTEEELIYEIFSRSALAEIVKQNSKNLQMTPSYKVHLAKTTR